MARATRRRRARAARPYDRNDHHSRVRRGDRAGRRPTLRRTDAQGRREAEAFPPRQGVQASAGARRAPLRPERPPRGTTSRRSPGRSARARGAQPRTDPAQACSVLFRVCSEGVGDGNRPPCRRWVRMAIGGAARLPDKSVRHFCPEVALASGCVALVRSTPIRGSRLFSASAQPILEAAQASRGRRGLCGHEAPDRAARPEKRRAPYEQPVAEPQVMHLRHAPLRTSVMC